MKKNVNETLQGQLTAQQDSQKDEKNYDKSLIHAAETNDDKVALYYQSHLCDGCFSVKTISTLKKVYQQNLNNFMMKMRC